MKHPPIFSTLILAGGKATRMNGKDKGLVIWQGQTLISHVLKNLPQEDVVISCNRNLDRYQRYGRVVKDEIPDFAGPLAGIAAALPHCQHEWIIITACDMPNLPIDIAKSLWQQLDGKKIAVAHDGEHLQPLLLLVHKSLIHTIQQQVSQGLTSVYKWLQSHPHTIIYFNDKNIFNNINSLQ